MNVKPGLTTNSTIPTTTTTEEETKASKKKMVDGTTPIKVKSTATARTKPVKKSTFARVPKSSIQTKKVSLSDFSNRI